MPDLTLVVSHQIPADDPDLRAIAGEIRVHYARGVAGSLEAFNARIAIGMLLLEARTKIDGDRQFGQWVQDQDFGWGPQWTTKLMQAARLEVYMREALPSSEAMEDGEPVPAPNFVKTLEAAKKLAVEAGEWKAPPVRTPVDPEKGIPAGPTPQDVLLSLASSPDVARFLAVENEEWLSVPPALRIDATAVFQRVTARMLAVHGIWKQNP